MGRTVHDSQRRRAAPCRNVPVTFTLGRVMNPRSRYYLAMAAWMVMSLTALAMVHNSAILSIVIMFASVVIGSWLLRRVDCPRCGSSIALYSSAAGLPLSHCGVCKLDLRVPFRGQPYDAA